ncbi:translation initiation factor IF-2 [Roseburia sp. CAG:197]|nr:translation initiation factor IF-2 [Roseburia sp. CAG:197]
MAKMRVHELAKELNIKSQDIIELLSTTDYAVKSASSGIEDAAQAVVRNKFSKKEDTKPAAKAEKAVTKAEDAKTEEGKERPKKKSSITAVFNAQYSKQSRRPGQGNGNNNRNNRDNNRGSRRDNGQQRPEQHSIIRPRPVGERAMRPISERTASNVDDFAESRPAKQNAEKQNNRSQNGNRQDRPNRSNGDRPQNGNRQDRQNRQDRPNRSNGDRPQNGNRQERPLNDRNNDRRNNNKGRFDKELNRFNKEAAAAAPEEVRGKEGRDRNNDRRNNNRHQEHDKLGGKRQENYVNLEKHGGKKKPQQQPQKPKEDEDVIKTITLPEKMTIRDLADKMKVQPAAIVKKLFMKGQMVTVNQEIDFDAAEEIALEFNYICEPEEKVDVIAELLKEDEEDPKNLVPRPPVVCVMGHVDHGKTSLLDAIRSTRVTDREAGGITQHIGASVVSINGQNITFLDTPGHEAFTAMRMRGANSTDIAILVVAADDGVMPQTVEAINHAKAAGVEIIVAVNKIDKPSANIEKVKQELSEYELIPEDWGGSTIFCPVSAHTKEGIDNLLEMILLTAEVLELKANPNRNARGLVIEAQLDKGRGAVATVLVQKGTLHVGDSIACGSSYGKVRAMIDDKGQRVKKAIPSTPVEILGLNSVPAAGETFVVCDSDKEAKAFADTYISEEKNRLIEDTKAKMSLDDLFSQIQSGNMKELDIIVKADVQGSVEAVKQSLVKLSNEEVVVKVIHGGVGAINESDVILASASNAIIIGFNVRPDPIAKVTADNEGVDIRLYKVIYNAIEDVEAAMKGMLDPVFEEKVIGHAEIRQIFKASGVGNIAGSYVLDGVMERGCRVRISREGNQIFEGDLASLKRFKDDVKEVKTGFECGLVFDGFNDIQEFDQVEAYKMVEVPR